MNLRYNFNHFLILCFSWLPWLGMALLSPLLLFAIHARYNLGYWPRYNLPDPKEMAFYEYYSEAINAAFTTQLFLLLLWIVAATVVLYKSERNWFTLFRRVSLWVLILSFWVFDPSGLFEWFVD